MRIEINGVRLFFDVDGVKYVPDGSAMRERPTLILLHGGPGLDHSSFKPAFSQFADIAQVIYIDHRGNGRSDGDDPDTWNLAQWGDDLYEFCRTLEIEEPIVMGQSFGGFVAISYGTRHPEHPGKLILSSTSCVGRAHADRSLELFEKFGGPAIVPIARKALMEGFDPETVREWVKVLPFYNRRAVPDPDASKRSVRKTKVLLKFSGADGEGRRFDMTADLAKIQCPTLVLGGEDDPMQPIESQEDIVAALPARLVRFERFANAGHGAYRDDPAAFQVIRDFIVS